MSHNNVEANYSHLLQDVVQEVEKYRIQAAQQLTSTLIQLYFPFRVFTSSYSIEISLQTLWIDYS
jgi:hypothetical protein